MVVLPPVVHFVQNFSTELIRQLFLDLPHFSSLAVVAQCPGHLLICHLLAVAFLNTPTVSKGFFVLGGKLEGSFVLIYPPNALLHVSIMQQLEKELIESNLLLTSCKIEDERFGEVGHLDLFTVAPW